MLNRSIVLLGASGIGKTTMLRKLFGVTNRYGYKAVTTGSTPVATVGKYQYIPEIRNTSKRKDDVTSGFISLLTNGNISVIDVNTTAPFALKLIKQYTNPKFYVLTATDKEIAERIMSRPQHQTCLLYTSPSPRDS